MWKTFVFDNYFATDRPEYPTEQAWESAMKHGYDGTYFSINRAQDFSWERATRFKEHSATYQIPLLACYTIVDLRDPNPSDRPSLHELLALLPEGSIMELTFSLDWMKDCSNPCHDDRALEIIRPLLLEAKKKKVQISLYHHLGFWTETIDDCVRLAEKVDDPDFGVTFCGYHWFAKGGLELDQKLDMAVPYLKLVNLCGSRVKPAGHDFPLPALIETVGSGEFPLAALLQKLLDVEYQGAIGFQGYLLQGDPDENMKQSREAYLQACEGLKSSRPKSVKT